MLSAVLLPLLLFLSTTQSAEPVSLTCKHTKSPICILQDVTETSLLEFVTLSEKHTLQIRSGNLTSFSKDIGDKLGSVKKLLLGRLGIKSLWISPNLQTLNAEYNQIEELEVELIEVPVVDEITPEKPKVPLDPAGIPDEDDFGAPKTSDTEEEVTKIPETEDEATKTSDAEEEVTKIPDTEDEATKTVDTEDEAAKTADTEDEVTKTSETEDAVTKASDTEDDTIDIPKPAPKASTVSKRSTTGTSASAYKLEILNLANNRLKSIQKLKPLINLKELRLDGNQLEVIEMDVFAGMTHLKKISLAKNQISQVTTATPLDLPSLEWFSLASNQLTTLPVTNWALPQLNELHLSSNKLVALDVINFSRFVSLEKLAIGENAWNCFWLRDSLSETDDGKLVIDLLDREEDCPSSSALPIHDTCCTMTAIPMTSEESQLDSAEQTGKISQLAESITRLKDDLERQVKEYNQKLETEWKKMDQAVKAKEEQLRKLAEEPNDDARVTGADFDELKKLIAETQDSLTKFTSLRTEYGKLEQDFTNLWHVVLAQKNKLLAGMRNAEKLREEMKQFEIDFNAKVN